MKTIFSDRNIFIFQNSLAVLLLIISIFGVRSILNIALIFAGVTVGTNIAYFTKSDSAKYFNSNMQKGIFIIPTVLLLLSTLAIYLELAIHFQIIALIALSISVIFSFIKLL